MRKIIMLAATLVASFCFTVPAMADAPKKFDLTNYEINWADEFNGTELNRKNWTPQIGNGNNYGIWEWGNNEKEYYKEENLTVSDGKLVIKGKYEPNAGKVGDVSYNFSSGRITSAGRVEVGYGYVEGRIKMPSAKGIWPAFWMLGTNGKTWPACGEIDIMEAFNTRNTLQSTIHYLGSDGKSDMYLYEQRNDLKKTDWHTFGCYRDGKIIAFYIDRELLVSYTTADNATGTRSVLNDKYYFLINMACGGNLAGGNPDSSLDADMEIDYVRYYTAKPAQPTVNPTPKTTAPVVKAPGKVKIKKAVNVKKKKIKLSIKKIAGVKGYKIRWCDTKDFQGYEEKTIKKTSYTIKGLSKGKWYIKIRAYKMNGTKKVWGKWSTVKTVKVRK
ncbi:MAG: family 16 glycosylhydrolase [Eubacterium sp.]|nr:family 16 glycosylhydrolase [Eubacterium sp.]